MRSLLSFALLLALSLGGCPPGTSLVPQANLTAYITTSSDRGPAPLTVYVSAAESTSADGTIVAVLWDFAGQAQANTINAVHTFTEPGRYTITLTITDSDDRQATTTLDVRVQGGPATAVIHTDVVSGPAPLSVQFDGTASSAEDDAILDYFWDFGDGETGRNATPKHTFRYAGTFTVQLRVVTFGGVEATTQTTITVEPGASTSASLQFNGGQFATLPLSVDATLSAFTFSAGFKADQQGGRLVSFGTPQVTLEILPSASVIRLQFGGTPVEATVGDLTGWRQITVEYDGANEAVISLDGMELTTAELSGNVAVTQLMLGLGFRGKVSGVSFAGTSASEAQDDPNNPADDPNDVGGDPNDVAPGGGASEPLGNWPLSDGSGQTLSNTVSGGTPGTLGATTAIENADPAWSSDSP